MNCSSSIEDYDRESGLTLLYEIDPSLNPKLPDENSKNDGFYGISDEYTMCMLDIAKWSK